MTRKKTNTNPAPTYAELGADLLKKLRDYSRLVGAKTFGATDKDREKQQHLENEIALAIARRGIIRKKAETVECAIRNTGVRACVLTDKSFFKREETGNTYCVFVAPEDRADVVGRAVSRNLKLECDYKVRWASRVGEISITITI